LAEELGCAYFETSAKDHVNVDECFSQLVREVRKILPKKEEVVLDLSARGNEELRGSSSSEASLKKKKSTLKCVLL
jgi:hypothetical protein